MPYQINLRPQQHRVKPANREITCKSCKALITSSQNPSVQSYFSVTCSEEWMNDVPAELHYKPSVKQPVTEHKTLHCYNFLTLSLVDITVLFSGWTRLMLPKRQYSPFPAQGMSARDTQKGDPENSEDLHVHNICAHLEKTDPPVSSPFWLPVFWQIITKLSALQHVYCSVCYMICASVLQLFQTAVCFL